jgi:2-desacetyl-2-hydroxyethyl bacteriochlorophyllide A dehydrogenase
MKAIVWTSYGPPEVLQIQDVEKPVPKDHEVLIKIHASTVMAGDCEMRNFNMPAFLWLPMRLYFGILKPRIKIPGQELSGEIESVGATVTQFRKGDQVFAPTEMNLGAHAEYICLPGNYAIVLKPPAVSYEEAATIPTGGLNALHFIRKANIQHGQQVLINGAGGSIGTYAVQLAKYLGAEVTAVDVTRKLEVLRSIGADHVIDYTQEDFSKRGKTYDTIIDIVGKHSFSRCVRSLKKNGIYVMGNPGFFEMIRGLWISLSGNKKIRPAVADYKAEDLIYLRELIEAGKIRSIIDKQYSLEHIADAHRYVDTGNKTGNVVITVFAG